MHPVGEKLHIIPHQHAISKEDRERQNGHKGHVLWFTGLSGSGKSTVASAVERELHQQGIKTFILDGDNVVQVSTAISTLVPPQGKKIFAALHTSVHL
jgi:adenylylsulfate kinase